MPIQTTARRTRAIHVFGLLTQCFFTSIICFSGGGTEAFGVLPTPRISRANRSKQAPQRTAFQSEGGALSLNSIVAPEEEVVENEIHTSRPTIVLVAGFESFNKELYQASAGNLDINLKLFTDSEIRRPMIPVRSTAEEGGDLNPDLRRAMESADAFIGSLVFDYDDVLAIQPLLANITGPRLLFECATELMAFNHIGTFSMAKGDEDSTTSASGPPPYVQAILSKFSSNKEEDKLSAYLKLLKIGPDLLKYVPGHKAEDLRTWLEAYRYWNQGGASNVNAMLQMLIRHLQSSEDGDGASSGMDWSSLPKLEVTPDVGVLHPLISESTGRKNLYFDNPKEYIQWRESKACETLANEQHYHLAPLDSPRVAILLYRKHVITKQRYIHDLITLMEGQEVLPIPIFINGVEAHTIVRDWLTSLPEIQGVRKGTIQRESTYQSQSSTQVDIIVNTIGFPLVGGPAGSMEAGRNVAVAEKLLSDMNVPYIVASPLLLQSIQQWKQNGVLGLQSVVLYSLPELDGAIDTVVLGGLVGDKIALVNERVRKLTDRVKGLFLLFYNLVVFSCPQIFKCLSSLRVGATSSDTKV